MPEFVPTPYLIIKELPIIIAQPMPKIKKSRILFFPNDFNDLHGPRMNGHSPKYN